MASPTEIAAMHRAVRLAARGLASTRPNPVVGAVVLDPMGAVVGEGWHLRPGGDHAEVRALTDAGERAWRMQGSKMFTPLNALQPHRPDGPVRTSTHRCRRTTCRGGRRRPD